MVIATYPEQTSCDAAPVTVLTAPKIEANVDGYTVTWDSGVEASVTRLEEHSGEVTCELAVNSTRAPDEGVLLSPARFNLMAPRTRTDIAKKLAQRDVDLDWEAMIEQLVVGVLERHRRGEPTIDMRFFEDDMASVWHLEPFLATEGPTVLFGDGGMGKSTLAVAMLASAAGVHVVGDAHATGPAMFLDYEGTARGFRTRLAAICDGAASPIPEIHYRREFASLQEAAPAIRREIVRLGVKTVALDSIGLACGGSPEAADVTLAFFRAVDSLRVPALLVDHITKNGGSDQTKAYGSVYKHNRPRLAWRVVSKQDDGGRRVMALTEHKHNDFAELPRLAYRVTINVDEGKRWKTVEFGRADPGRDGAAADLLLRGQARLKTALHGGGMSAEDLAIEVDQPLESVKRTLRRYRGTSFIEKDGQWWNQEN